MKNNLVVLPEVVSAPLATEHKHVTPTFADHALLRTLGIDTGSYVLCVGTMEIRKNNLYLVKVWEQLIRIHGVNNIPKLVFCGKRGWHNEEFFDYIEDKQYVGTWLHLIESAPETLLSLLYEKSLFTCFVSYAEGWGLPISESLSYGKLCVASKTTSMPEVGGQFCLYIDPYDPNSGFDVINKLIVDKVFFNYREDFIKNNYKEKTWRDFSQEITGFIDNSKLINQSGVYCFIPPSTITSSGNYDVRKAVDLDKPILSSKMAATSGWHQIEDWGIWASKSVAIFECAIESKKDTLISCFIKLKCPDEMGFTTVSVVQSGFVIETFNVTSKPQWYTFDVDIHTGSKLEIKLVSPSRRFVSPDSRGKIFFGILGFAYSSGDLISTVSLIKKVINDGVNVININTIDQKETATDIPRKEFEVISTEIAANAIADFVSTFYSEIKPSFFERFFGSLYLQKARNNARKKRWEAAAMYYMKMFNRGLIEAKPVVQLGHALNESGLHRAAFIAYSIAYHLSPDDDDVKFHYELNLERLRKT
ncbi:glycosyltransferase [Acidithiobacillus caldus]|nr:glycosyltransferase [Acidithiobacillus caldus]MBU2745071.1 glycosyltransferase family 4 protein [Acidithiobacillus caldus]